MSNRAPVVGPTRDRPRRQWPRRRSRRRTRTPSALAWTPCRTTPAGAVLGTEVFSRNPAPSVGLMCIHPVSEGEKTRGSRGEGGGLACGIFVSPSCQCARPRAPRAQPAAGPPAGSPHGGALRRPAGGKAGAPRPTCGGPETENQKRQKIRRDREGLLNRPCSAVPFFVCR